MPIDLNSTNQIPKSILRSLTKLKAAFVKVATVDELVEKKELKNFAQDLNQICLNEGVKGYHFTRGIRASIAKLGLMPCIGEYRRERFLSEYGNRFTAHQRNWITKSWDEYFTPQQSEPRNGKIWFNFTFEALKNGGAEDLLVYYGGESIYMPLIQNVEIASVLRSIGQALTVECNLDAKKLKTFCEIPWGKIWLSYFHLTPNPDAIRFDQDAFQEQPVLASQIVSIKVVRNSHF